MRFRLTNSRRLGTESGAPGAGIRHRINGEASALTTADAIHASISSTFTKSMHPGGRAVGLTAIRLAGRVVTDVIAEALGRRAAVP
jgi:hypothetical protein